MLVGVLPTAQYPADGTTAFVHKRVAPTPKDYVILQHTKTLDEAENFAKIKNSVQEPLASPNAAEMIALLASLNKQFIYLHLLSWNSH